MGYRVKDIPDLKVIEVTVTGLLDFRLRKQLLNLSIHKLRTIGYDKLLIDIIHTYSPLNQTMSEAIQLTTFMKEAGYHKELKLAFIYQNDENLRLYLESTALARGYHLQYFREREHAIAWLCNSRL